MARNPHPTASYIHGSYLHGSLIREVKVKTITILLPEPPELSFSGTCLLMLKTSNALTHVRWQRQLWGEVSADSGNDFILPIMSRMYRKNGTSNLLSSVCILSLRFYQLTIEISCFHIVAFLFGGGGDGVAAQKLRLLKNREANAATTLQKLWRKAIAKMLATRLRRWVDGCPRLMIIMPESDAVRK